MKKQLHLIELIKMLAIPLIVGGLSAFLTKDSFTSYQEMNKPPLSPPGIVFPIVWTILYILMGISMYLIVTDDSISKEDRKGIYIAYGIQLFLNFIWTPVFFVLKNYFLASIILALLIGFVWRWLVAMFRKNKLAGGLQIPYMAWCIFAFYLNVAAVGLNQQKILVG